ncbi:MAG: helix-turn-helix domain-containing protein, partial [Spirochaetales bacterium]|nr:helix-turn-helix domain-containing protein [Candidatus Physcosoma equi]
MEKKTMGSFMAALRKAQGMTQRELAERLNVSDKSISRWECDDGYPDVSMLPVIAEIFGITVDELLRGERKAERPSSNGGSTSVSNDKKSAKELKRLRDLQVSSFRSRSILSMGIAFLGVLFSAVINIGFLRGPLAFFVGSLFILSSVVLEAISINSVLSRDYEEVDDGHLKNT